MPAYHVPPRERAIGIAGAVLIHALLGYVLIAGLAAHAPEVVDDTLKLFQVAPEPPPPPREETQPHPVRSKQPEGAAAPPNIRSTPTEIVALPPVVQVVLPPSPVVVAPVAGTGADASQGAADIVGPGTGAGGIGDGTGSGRYGDGGGAGGDELPPRWRRGALRDSDYPDGLGEAGISGTVSVRYLVATNGRVVECEVTKSSGSAVLDDTTCRLIMQRFRYEPSRDARGRPVPSYIVEDHSWIVEPDRDPPPPR